MERIPLTIPIGAIRVFCERHPIRRLALFGSVLRDDFSPDSDVDVLVEFAPGADVTYLDLVAMQEELAALLGRSVDLLTPGALSPHFREQVLSSAETVYERR
jgi:predicted nucleotidyltransferase